MSNVPGHEEKHDGGATTEGEEQRNDEVAAKRYHSWSLRKIRRPELRLDWFDSSTTMNQSENVRPEIEVIRASLEQKPILANLLELYSHDFCEFVDLEIGPDGRFGYRELDLYWTDPDRLPFLVYVDTRLAGFALIKTFQRDGTVWDMTEFFILRGYRGQGTGTEAARKMWTRFPGNWEVRVMATNEPAYRFWYRAIESFTCDDFLETRYHQTGKNWRRFSFASKAGQGTATP